MIKIKGSILITFFLLQSYSIAQVEYSTPLNVTFDEISISIEDVRPGDYESPEPYNQTSDSSQFFMDLGDIIEGKVLKINSSKLNDVKIFQRYQTSVSIQNEGPHIDLTDWKHYESDWKEIEKDEEGDYRITEYSLEESQKFPEVDIEELKTAVHNIAGQEWRNLIEDIKSPTEYPSSVTIDKIELKVTGNREGKDVEKIIIFNYPMGC